MDIHEVLSKLDKVKKSSQGWKALCPAHDDKNPSLHIKDKNGNIYTDCYAGCDPEKVREAIGLTWRDTVAKKVNFNGQNYAQQSIAKKSPVTIWPAYHAVTGKHVADKIRKDSKTGKMMYWAQPNKKEALSGADGRDYALYNIKKVVNQAYVIITEGEKATDHLYLNGFSAAGTVTGANSCPENIVFEPIKDKTIYLWPDNDEPGKRYMKIIGAALKAIGAKDIRVINWVDAPPQGDAADIDPEGYVSTTQALLENAQPYQASDVNLAELLDRIEMQIADFVIFQTPAANRTCALWVAHTYAFMAAQCTPYLLITSPSKQCGKSRLLDIMKLLVKTPFKCSGVTAAALLRMIDQKKPTVLIDETDSKFVNDEYIAAIQGVLNSGYETGGVHYQCDGNNNELKEFETFSAKCLAGIGMKHIPDTVLDRCIVIELHRKLKNQEVKKLRKRTAQKDFEPIRNTLDDWASAAVIDLMEAEPKMPEGLEDRKEDIWEPLFAIADLAGGHWPDQARKDAVELSGSDQFDEDQSMSVKLLTDLRTIFTEQNREFILTKEIILELENIEESPWATYRRNTNPITARQLAGLLKPYGIFSHKNKGNKGYKTLDFIDPFSRYLPPLVLPPQYEGENRGDLAVLEKG